MSNFKLSQKNALVSIKIDQIQTEPGKFSMSYGFDNSELKRSISQVGIINNPCIYRNIDGAIEIVTGFRRILALRSLNVKEIECFDLTDSGMSSYEMLKFAIHDNLFSRDFNLVEKSLIINKLTSLVNEDYLIKEFSSLIDVNFKDYELILKIEGMDESIKKSISAGHLSLKALEHLIQLPGDSQVICNSWITNLKLNYNQQTQFLDYINDISRIEKLSIQKLLNDEVYLNLLADKKKNTPQKAKELIDSLRERRNPDFSKYKHLFEKKIRRLQLPKNININHPRYFEAELYKLEVEFKDGHELKKRLNELANLDNIEDIGDPWLKE